jgi:hypothetical protein
LDEELLYSKVLTVHPQDNFGPSATTKSLIHIKPGTYGFSCVAPTYYAQKALSFGVCVMGEKKEIDFRSSPMACFVGLEQSKQNHDFDPGPLRRWDVALPSELRFVYP